MARAPKTPTTTSTAIVPWDERLAQEAEIAAGMEANSGGGQFFSFRGGMMSFNDAPVPGNQLAVVILDSVLENVFYEGAYDPDTPMPPTCFAFGRDEATIAPHQTVFDHEQAQHDQCKGCPMNEWGTADKGRGKACRNTRRLGVIQAGEIDERGQFKPFTDPEHFEKAGVGYMKLPVTSVKGYATFVKQVAGALRRPPYGIFTKIRLIPDAKTQIKVLFEPISKVPDALMSAIVARHEEVMSVIEFPYSLDVEERQEPAKKPAARGAKPVPATSRPPVKKPAGKKY